MKTLEQRFLSKVIIPRDRNACWEWLGSKSRGYGQIGYKYKLMSAHRLSFLMFNGNLIDGLVVMHTCDNPCCVNPNHLIQGTHKQNMQDCANKGRNAMQREDRGPHYNQLKTHCPYGHEYTEENTFKAPGQGRKCRTCARDNQLRKRKRCNTPT
jgi:hypothetical protein